MNDIDNLKNRQRVIKIILIVLSILFLLMNIIVFFKRNGNGFNIIPVSFCIFWILYGMIMLICSFRYKEIVSFLRVKLNGYLSIIFIFIHSIILALYVSTISYDYNCSETYQKCCINSNRNSKVYLFYFYH